MTYCCALLWFLCRPSHDGESVYSLFGIIIHATRYVQRLNPANNTAIIKPIRTLVDDISSCSAIPPQTPAIFLSSVDLRNFILPPLCTTINFCLNSNLFSNHHKTLSNYKPICFSSLNTTFKKYLITILISVIFNSHIQNSFSIALLSIKNTSYHIISFCKWRNILC
jgi:hypothetical protein